MNIIRHFACYASVAATVVLLTLSLYLPAAGAAMIGTGTVVQDNLTLQERGLIQDTLNREEVKTKLLSLGVDPAQVQARVDALTVAEIRTISQKFDQLPAGSGVIGLLLVILLLVLVL
ncbi:MAG: PA2779 family protein [Gammaproteobacteria bacterium]|nr:PA2779 family protein [Gammaproteobacteria bacterium]